MKKLFSYYGGKYYMIRDILNVVEPLYLKGKLTCFVDVFGGSGSVLMNIPQNWKINRVYNDIDSRIYKVMIALINEEKRNKLLENLNWAIRSREYFNNIKKKPIEEWTELDTLYMLTIGYNGMIDSNSYRILIGPYRNLLQATINNLTKNYNLLKNWNLEHLDFRELILKYDSPTTFFYLDPPYLNGGKSYRYSFKIDDFKELKNILDNLKGYWLMNESSVDFENIKKIFGESKLVKEYINRVVNKETIINNNGKKTMRLEGFWCNFKIIEDKVDENNGSD